MLTALLHGLQERFESHISDQGALYNKMALTLEILNIQLLQEKQSVPQRYEKSLKKTEVRALTTAENKITCFRFSSRKSQKNSKYGKSSYTLNKC